MPCDVVLSPTDSIQGAVDAVGEGGVVCLGSGTYYLTATIFLTSAHTGLMLREDSGASPVVNQTSNIVSSVIELDGAHEVSISGLTITSVNCSSSHAATR